MPSNSSRGGDATDKNNDNNIGTQSSAGVEDIFGDNGLRDSGKPIPNILKSSEEDHISASGGDMMYKNTRYELPDIAGRFSQRTLIRFFAIVGFAVFSALAVALYLYAYTSGLKAGQKDLPPIVGADDKAAKIRISEAEKNKAMAQNPDDVKNTMREDMPSGVERRRTYNNEAPPANASGEVESLQLAQAVADPTRLIPSKNPELDNKKPVKKAIEIPKTKVPPPALSNNATPVPPRAAGTTPPPAMMPKQPTMAESNFVVQIGAMRTMAQAQALFDRAKREHADLLAGYEPVITRIDLGDEGLFMRVNITGFATKSDAQDFCKQLKRRGQNCLARPVE